VTLIKGRVTKREIQRESDTAQGMMLTCVLGPWRWERNLACKPEV